MRTLLLMTAAALSLAGCESAEQKAAKAAARSAALKVCPPADVMTDITSYSNEVAAANSDQKAFFAANGKLPGVKTTESGLQYRVTRSGNSNGPQPAPTDKVRVHYHGQFMDGRMFDSSYERGQDIDFPLDAVIKGWTEGVGLMRPCDAWTFFIPSDLAYGPRGRGQIPPATPLMFHVQLIEVK